jgi:hypothetical protein
MVYFNFGFEFPGKMTGNLLLQIILTGICIDKNKNARYQKQDD